MKKNIGVNIILCIILLISVGCSDGVSSDKKIDNTSESQSITENQAIENTADTTESDMPQDKKLVVYTTFFPVRDLSQRIIGDKMEIHMIIEGTEQPHDFELKAKDMTEIADADLIIYNGAGMEAFIDDLKEVVNDDDKFLDLSQGLTLLESGEAVSGGNHDNVNPHTWLSIKNAMEQLDTIYQKISVIDPVHDAYYKDNLEDSLAEFAILEKEFNERLSGIDRDEKYFVVSHAAFNYLAYDYGLKQIAVTGVSPEEEPSAKALKEIADFVADHHISTIFFEGKATPKVAETLARETGAKTATLITMENMTDEEVEMGYLNIMKANLDALVESFDE